MIWCVAAFWALTNHDQQDKASPAQPPPERVSFVARCIDARHVWHLAECQEIDRKLQARARKDTK